MYVFVFLVQLEIRIYLINIVIQPTHYLSLMQELNREREDVLTKKMSANLLLFF
jgi:hypothetical protein